VVLEEDFYDKLSYDFTDLKKYENKAASRFEIRNKEKNVLDTSSKYIQKNPVNILMAKIWRIKNDIIKMLFLKF
jgi:hypothetical protein